jgi:hypothetical protein
VEFVRLLLVFLHLLAMASMVGTFFMQQQEPEGSRLNVGWLHLGILQLLTGVALQLLGPATDQDYIEAKLGVKMLVLLIIVGLALTFVLRKVPAPKWLNPALGGLVVLNVGLAVFWT